MKRLPFTATPGGAVVISGISSAFAGLSQSQGQVSYVLLTRSPLGNKVRHAEAISSKHPVRLACVKRAASVRSEPESNSQFLNKRLAGLLFKFSKIS